jgi:hypothetical protein
MKILEYVGLDTSGVESGYRKVTEAIARNDFRAAQVKKLVNSSHGNLYRAKLDDAGRLLFTLVRHGDEACALMLEVIANHEYDKSRFLRGAVIDEAKIAAVDLPEAMADAQPLRYLHPRHTAIHLLDKPVSFDDTQEAVYRQPPPLIIVGTAGSGKTALTLEKLKHAEGEVLYITHSSFLAENARNLYYANGFRHAGQESHFLSFREFIESICVPSGREAIWRDFSAWFARVRNAFKELDAHQAFEEIRGVITAGSGGILSSHDYRKLGVRQSIYSGSHRERLYELFVKYRQWLDGEGLYDLNMVAYDWMTLAAPRYDFVVVDEVQDLTAVQLSLILRTLKKPGHFLLCGDSNQIVHPNFFSWSQVKSLFWNDPKLAERQQLCILTANFRNGTEATRLANRLLKIKQQRFGSIDRESNYLVDPVGGEAGLVALMADSDPVKQEINKKTKKSTRYAVLVMRDEDKAEARKHFSTPLLFSIHEAKGLEYDNIVLYRFLSGNRKEFAELVEGVDMAGLTADTLEYSRARDKSDKSLEVYKFFVNALYVALTRAIKNLYIIESDTGHRLFNLLELSVAGKVAVAEANSTLEEWQKEARKLEQQGKQEQADNIRSTILCQTPPSWTVIDEPHLKEMQHKVFQEQLPGSKFRQQLYEYAACHDEPVLARRLVTEAGFEPARKFLQQRDTLGRKSFLPYFSQQTKGILKQCEQHGVDHRLIMNQTPLMAAAAAGNIPLVEALLDSGADLEKTDQYGYNALHWSMREAFRAPKFARGNFAALYELLAPSFIDVKSSDRLVRIDRHLSEFFLFQTLWVLFKTRFTYRLRRPYAAFETRAILDAWEHMPSNVVSPERNRRQHLSSVLARNEVSSDYAYNRALFARITQGWYQFNPQLAVRSSHDRERSDWKPVYEALNLPLVYEFSNDYVEAQVAEYFKAAGMKLPDALVSSENSQTHRNNLHYPVGRTHRNQSIQQLIDDLMNRKMDIKVRNSDDSEEKEPKRVKTERRAERESEGGKRKTSGPSPDQLGFDL